MSLVNEYPYTNFHDVNLDYILKLVRENAGLHLEIVGNKLVMKTADNSIVSSVTISYAETADQANTATQANYAATAGVAATAQHASTADTATSATTASEAVHAASSDTATTATTATNATNAVYATSAGSATNATNAVNAQNATYATSAGSVEHVENAIEDATTWTSFLRFIKGNGEDIMIQAPFSKAAQKDNLGNVIDTTYIASVVDDNGVLKFKNANGAVLFSITPSSQSATEDSYGNTIADFIKTITAPSDSNYVTVQHGTGAAETLTINYSNAAWKDTNGNVIKNFYAGSMEIVEDAQTGHYNLVVYNGDTPKAELYRFEILAYKAQEAEEADHAAAADYATDAGHAATADSATTSTGSISSITTPSDESDSFTINNGDGTTKKIDIHNKSIIEINLYGDGIKTNPPDLAVNASEDYEVDTDDLSKYRYISDISDLITPNINFVYNEQSGGLVIFNAISQQVTVSGNTAIILSVFNGTSTVVLQIEESNNAGYVTITRLL